MATGDSKYKTEITERQLEELNSRIVLLEGELAVRDGLEVLAGGIAHDFNNLLTVILNNVSLMKLETAPGSGKMIGLEEMEKATLKARDLALRLLNIAGNESPPPSEEESEAAIDPPIESLKGSGRILMVDDEESVRTSTGAALTRLGYSVILAENGSKAIEIFRQSKDEGRPFDAVILDLTVQGGSGGKQTVSSLKQINPEVRAVVSSGYANAPVMIDYMDFGFSGKLAKPYTMEDLGRVIKKVMEDPGSKV